MSPVDLKLVLPRPPERQVIMLEPGGVHPEGVGRRVPVEGDRPVASQHFPRVVLRARLEQTLSLILYG